MLLKNFYKYVAIHTMTNGTPVSVVDTSGTTSNAMMNSYKYGLYTSMTGVSKSKTYEGIVLGSGTTPVSFDDYNLNTIIMDGSATVSNSVNISDDGLVTNTSLITFTNTTSTEIVIREIGLIVQLGKASNTNSGAYILVERTVLDNPITLQPNEVGQITYSISYQLKMS